MDQLEFEDTCAELRAEVAHQKRYQAQLARHPDPRDPDWPGHAEEPEEDSLTTHLNTIEEWLSVAKLARDRADTARMRQAIDEIHCECSAALGMD